MSLTTLLQIILTVAIILSLLFGVTYTYKHASDIFKYYFIAAMIVVAFILEILVLREIGKWII